MKRRSFIGMLGAATVAPALPAAAPYAQMQMLLATHVRKYPIITALGISNRAGVDMEAAEKLLRELSQSGFVDTIATSPTGRLRARSTLFQPVEPTVLSANDPELQKQLKRAKLNRQRLTVRNQDWLAHLRGICAANDIPLQPRALEYAA